MKWCLHCKFCLHVDLCHSREDTASPLPLAASLAGSDQLPPLGRVSLPSRTRKAHSQSLSLSLALSQSLSLFPIHVPTRAPTSTAFHELQTLLTWSATTKQLFFFLSVPFFFGKNSLTVFFYMAIEKVQCGIFHKPGKLQSGTFQKHGTPFRSVF